MAEATLSHGIDLDGISPEDAFAILGNGIRLDILRVLWEATATDGNPDTASTLTYSQLLRGVDLRDSGKFNYHLSKLTPHFVQETDDGYRLTTGGERVARTVMAVSDGAATEFPSELGADCPLCGGQLIANYHDQHLHVECTECSGRYGEDAPEGVISIMGFPAAGLTDRTPAEVLEGSLYRCMLDLAYLMHGVCRECAGPIASTVSVCDDHDPGDDSTCQTCGTPHEVWAEQRCERCGLAKRLPVQFFVWGLAPVIGFFYDHGVNLLEPSYEELDVCLETMYTVSVAEDPLRIQVTIDADGDELVLTLDDTMTVVEVTRHRPEPVSHS